MSYYLCLLFFVMEYVRPTSYVPALMVLRLNTLVPLSAFAGTLAGVTSATRERMLAEPNSRAIAGMLFLVWLSFLTADVQERVWNCLTMIGGFAVVYWVLGCELSSVGKIKGVFKTLVLVHIAVAALNPVLFTDPETRHYVSSGAFLGDGNDFALSLNIIIPLCLFLFLDSRRVVMKLVWAMAILVCVAGVVVTQSRGGTIGLACMGLYYWMKSRKKVQTALIGVLVVGLILAFAPGNYFQRMNMIADTTEGSASARLTAWRVATRMALDNPLLGVGAAHFGVKFGNEYRPPDAVGSGMTAHSIYFLALGELGVPGLGWLLYFIVSNLVANRRLANEIRARGHATSDIDLQLLASTSASMIAFATAGAFLSALYYPHLYVLAGILVATRAVVRERIAGPLAQTAKPARQAVSVHWALRRPAPASTAARRLQR